MSTRCVRSYGKLDFMACPLARPKAAKWLAMLVACIHVLLSSVVTFHSCLGVGHLRTCLGAVAVTLIHVLARSRSHSYMPCYAECNLAR